MEAKMLFVRHPWKKFSMHNYYFTTLRRQSTYDARTKSWPVTCTFNPDCVYDRMKDIEKKWSHLQTSPPEYDPTSRNPVKYVLAMFPYPSGSLHLGHVKLYTSSDVISRYYRMLGYQVINPIGWDSFGLPAENAGLERECLPSSWTEKNIQEMRSQLSSLGLEIHEREATSQVSFYRWTQSIIIELFKHKLLYKSPASVNWDPIDQTVLADHQVDNEGRSWRSGSKVEKRLLNQWFIKTSRFVEDLYEGKGVNVSEDGVHLEKVLKIQRKWIGNLNGRVFYLPINDDNHHVIAVFTGRADLFMQPNVKLLVSNDHWILYQGMTSIPNPFTGKSIEIISSSPDQESQIPSNFKASLFCDQLENRDIKRDGSLIESILKQNPSLGGYITSSTFTDWLISRQRYWGCPLPIINCHSCGPVADEELPVVLPEITDFKRLKENRKSNSDEVTSKLGEVAPKDWINVKCPSCGSNAKRETDTCDTFVDSSWYYLRFASHPYSSSSFDTEFWQRSNVSVYLGGPEHITGHLLYSRLIFHFLTKYGYLENTPFTEPYNSFVLQGIVTAKTYRDKETLKYLTPEEAKRYPKDKLIITQDKMSKSKLNGVNPLDLISWKGREATRMTVVGEESSHRQRNWRGIEAEFKQMTGFLRKVMLVMDQFIQVRQMSSDQYPVIKRFAFKSNNQMKNPIDVEQELSRLKNLRNETIVKVKLHFGHDFKLGRGTKKLQELMYALSINVLVKEVSTDIEFEKTLGDFIVMMSALTPALAQELWEAFVDYADQDQLNDRYNFKDRNVRNQSFPEIDNDHIIPIIVKVDDDSLNIPVDRQIITRSDEQEIRKIAVEFCQNNRSLNDFNVDWNECVKRIHLSPGLKAVVKIETGFKTEKKSFAKKKKSKKDEDSDSEEEDR